MDTARPALSSCHAPLLLLHATSSGLEHDPARWLVQLLGCRRRPSAHVRFALHRSSSASKHRWNAAAASWHRNAGLSSRSPPDGRWTIRHPERPDLPFLASGRALCPADALFGHTHGPGSCSSHRFLLGRTGAPPRFPIALRRTAQAHHSQCEDPCRRASGQRRTYPAHHAASGAKQTGPVHNVSRASRSEAGPALRQPGRGTA